MALALTFQLNKQIIGLLTSIAQAFVVKTVDPEANADLLLYIRANVPYLTLPGSSLVYSQKVLKPNLQWQVLLRGTSFLLSMVEHNII